MKRPFEKDYVLVDQAKACIGVLRRADDWQPDSIKRTDVVLRPTSITSEMPVADVYAGGRGPVVMAAILEGSPAQEQGAVCRHHRRL